MPLTYAKFKWSKYYCYLDYCRKLDGMPINKLPEEPDYYKIWPKIVDEPLQFQSEALPAGGAAAVEVESAPVMEIVDEEGHPEEDMSATIPDYVYNDASTSTDISQYLSRYVSIATATWNESDATGISIIDIEPWREFFNNAFIKRKVQNYAFIRCNLELKIMINASPFYYGCARAFYIPKGGLNGANNPYFKDASEKWQIPVSQLPNIELLPSEGTGGSMIVPYLSENQFIKVGVSQDFGNMGQLIITPITILRSANGVSGQGVNIVVYARAVDVVLSGATVEAPLQSLHYQAKAQILDEVTSSAKKKNAKRNWRRVAPASDEYGDQVASSVASAVAAASGQLRGLPLIGKFATVAEIVASNAAKGLKALGFSNLPNINNFEPVKLGAFPPLATTEVSYPYEPLGIDPKNSLTIDNSIVGLPTKDELQISEIVTKPSYLTKFIWDNSGVSDDLLFTCGVTPQLLGVSSTTGATVFQQTPMSWCAALFNYWRGDIIFKFKVVSSPYHKGRLRISYEPTIQATNNIALVPSNVGAVFNTIVDIGEENEVEVRIPYMQSKPWQRLVNIDDLAEYFSLSSAFGGFTSQTDNFNGQLTVRILNRLTSPASSAPVNVMVTVRAADNLSFGAPGLLPNTAARATRVSYAQPQSEVCASDPTVENPSQYLLNMGEKIVSLRQLLRRANYYGSLTANCSPTTDLFYELSWPITRFPVQTGFTTNVTTTTPSIVTTGNKTFNFARLTPLEYICGAFAGIRGSINWTINPLGPNVPRRLTFFRYSRQTLRDFSSQAYNVGITPITITDAASNSQLTYRTNYPDGGAGSTVTSCEVQPTLNFSWPMYNNRVIEPTRDLRDTLMGEVRSLSTRSSNEKVYPCPVELYVSGGPDLNTVFFLCAPTVFYYSTNIVPN